MPFNLPELDALRKRTQGDLESTLPGVRAQQQGAAKTLADLNAGAARGFYLQQQASALNLFPDTAKAEALERWVSVWGIARKKAAQAVGGAVFTGQIGASVPIDLGLQGAKGQRYTTTQSGVLGANGQISIAVKASEGGGKGNAGAGETLTLASTVAGLNPTASVGVGGLVGGTHAETDEALRTRLMARIRAQERIGAAADYKAWALAQAGVDRVWVFPAYGGEAGVVAVFITVPTNAGGPQANAVKINEVKTAIDALKPASAVLRVLTPTLHPVAVQAALTPYTQALDDAVRGEVAKAFNQARSVGEAMPRSVISSAFARVEGLASWVLTQPAGATQPAMGALPVLGTLTLGAADG